MNNDRMTSRDFRALAERIRANEYTERTGRRLAFNLPGHAYCVRCADTDKAREALALRIEKAKPASGTRGVRLAAHPNPANVPAYSTSTHAGFLVPDGQIDWLTSNTYSVPYKAVLYALSNAMQYGDDHGQTPVVVVWSHPAVKSTNAQDSGLPYIPSTALLVPQSPVELKTKSGGVVTMEVGQVLTIDDVTNVSGTLWAECSLRYTAGNPYHGSGLGGSVQLGKPGASINAISKKVKASWDKVSDSAREAAYRAIEQARKDGDHETRVKALRDWIDSGISENGANNNGR
jgi:hypothetical protein